MKRERLENLIKEFEEICGEAEAEDSASTALFISKSFNYERSDELKLHFLKQLKKEEQGKQSSRYFLLPLLLAVLIIFSFVYKVEASRPGDMFYPVKEFSNLLQNNVKKIAAPQENIQNSGVSAQPSITKIPDKKENASKKPAKAINKNGVLQESAPPVKKENQTISETKEDLEKKVGEAKEAVTDIVEDVIDTELPLAVPQAPQSLQNNLGL